VKGEEPVQIPTRIPLAPRHLNLAEARAEEVARRAAQSPEERKTEAQQRADDALNQKIYGGMSAEDSLL